MPQTTNYVLGNTSRDSCFVILIDIKNLNLMKLKVTDALVGT